MPGTPITEFGPELEKFSADMIETMYAFEGVGLAAQQVDRAVRLCVIDVSHLADDELFFRIDGLRPPIDLVMPMVMANPVVTVVGDQKVTGEEGCLSFPGIRLDVTRATTIEVRYQDAKGQAHLMECAGWLARVVQHEVDHLEGRLFIDRIDKRQYRMVTTKLKRLRKATLQNFLENSPQDEN